MIKFFENRHIRDISLIIAGCFVMSFAYAKLIVPYKIINGGVTSLSLLLVRFVPLSIDIVNMLLLAMLLLLTMIFLGREVFLKSIVTSIVYSIFFSAFIHAPFSIHFPGVVSMLIASLLIAFGYFCCLSSNSSTLGVDVFALIIHKYNKKIPLAKMIRFFNFIILFGGFFVYGFYPIVLGFCFSYIYSFELHFMLEHFQNKKDYKQRS